MLHTFINPCSSKALLLNISHFVAPSPQPLLSRPTTSNLLPTGIDRLLGAPFRSY